MNNEFSISNIKSRQIIDSRGNPTIETDVILAGGGIGRAAVPSGASTGSGEALELRDKDETKYGGKGVLKAVENVNTTIRSALLGRDATDQNAIDQFMINLDATENKSALGANAILSVSLAVAKAAAHQKATPLFRYFAILAENENLNLPIPMINVINGGEHGGWATDPQEYMIIPKGAETIQDAVRMGAEVFHALGKILKERGYPTTVGDEGGYAPPVQNGNEEPFELIQLATEKAGYKFGEDIVLSSDVAASEFYNPETSIYTLKRDNVTRTSDDMINWYKYLIDKYPIVSIEDGLAESDWAGWQNLTTQTGKVLITPELQEAHEKDPENNPLPQPASPLNHLQIVGDDLLVTNPKLLQKAIDEKSCNSILIKVNQIGTLTETIQAVNLAKSNGFTAVISHRSGETEDTTIAHLAVGLGAGQIKTGSMSRSDRIAKYNELLRISEIAPELPLAKPF
ncbi:enolase [Candidatus Saccharibacteria bacterium]|nr:enolase [Candidatus Saccharibacteria bacterium]